MLLSCCIKGRKIGWEGIWNIFFEKRFGILNFLYFCGLENIGV